MLAWIKSWFRPRFKPAVFYNEDLRLTEIVLRDTSIVWCPWGPYKGHAVDCGYDENDDLVAIKIWDDVRTRNTPTEAIHRGAEILRELYQKRST